MKKKIFSFLLCSVVTIGVFAGCSKKQEVTNTKGTRSITHTMGSTDVPINPKRVVILTNEGTEDLLELGIKPVGAVSSWTGTGTWYSHIANEMKDVKDVGQESNVNLEAVAALKPDLIIGNKMRHEKIYSQLSAIAPTVYSDTLRGAWKDNFKFYAKVFGKEAEGENIVKKFDDRVQKIKEDNKDKLNNKISLVRFMSGKTRLYLGDTFAGTILKEIGFARPDSQQGTDFVKEIGKERIKEADGDIMFYYTYETGDGKGEAREQEWVQDPLFKSLSVVKNGKAYKVNDAIWNTSGGVKAANLMLDDLEKFAKEGKL
ncbi:iron siderophore-binding protein [Clostridium zeae]|uniref:Iron siderophore-binding protein n=1 Tax=Clostridium zeae TaxID=2759022 RepID=A0ABQ1EI80_9CLOT|nr:iron-siderophore ABC transporter substrate-binding protein [Clostridium zeae]GFZ34386.1 iron siderophore-binding protein [Clostridium zeae]